MRRLKKKIYLTLCGSLVGVLSVVRMCSPGVMPVAKTMQASFTDTLTGNSDSTALQPMLHKENFPRTSATYPDGDNIAWHKLGSVHSYKKCFPDVQDVQIQAAMQWGVPPVANREEAEQRKSELVYVAADPYFCIDRNMSHSIPYLVPRAHDLLRNIGRSFLDSLYVKGIPLHRIIVSSVLRTEDDVNRLRKRNGNASEQSCHRYGTTFDIAYNRYSTVSPPEGPERRAVRNDTLKWVLSQVLRDLRSDSLCYVKYESKQGCFHITVR
ncbi:MAG: DUF5715 family protein [Bacteroidaceae bacterium]